MKGRGRCRSAQRQSENAGVPSSQGVPTLKIKEHNGYLVVWRFLRRTFSRDSASLNTFNSIMVSSPHSILVISMKYHTNFGNFSPEALNAGLNRTSFRFDVLMPRLLILAWFNS